MLEKENDLILRPAPITWYRIGESERTDERERQAEFPFMDETPPTRVFSFIKKESPNPF